MKRLIEQRALVLFKTIENHQLHIRASKQTFRSNDDKDFEDETNFKANDIELLKQAYTNKSEVRRINLFLALFRAKKVEIEKISRSQISPFLSVFESFNVDV